MRRIFLASAFLSVISVVSVGAQAADLAPVYKATPAVPPVPMFSWTGPYVGVNLGGVVGHSDVDPNLGTPFPVFTSNPLLVPFLITPAQIGAFPGTSGSDTSVIGGVQAGYNWQMGSWVSGLEADIDGTGLRESSSASVTRTTVSGTQSVTANYSAQIDWIATVRGRFGYAFDRTMVYGTAGAAFAGTRLNTNYAEVQPFPVPTPGSASGSGLAVGWTAGIGAEWAFRPEWTFGVEYRHTAFQRDFLTGFADVSLEPFVGPNKTTVHFVNDQVTARLNWRPWQ